MTQMKWRLEEGSGEAIYEIGVEDNGILTGLNEADLQASVSTLEKMAKRYGGCMDAVLYFVYCFCPSGNCPMGNWVHFAPAVTD